MGIILKHILKCLIIAFPMLFVSTSMHAESKDSRISGYRGNLSFSITPEIESEVPIGIDITTSHGYSFGNGWWLGAGIGIMGYHGVIIPIFSEAQYSFTKSQLSPYVFTKIGHAISVEDGYGCYLSLGFGVCIKSFSVFTSYSKTEIYNLSNTSIGCSWNF